MRENSANSKMDQRILVFAIAIALCVFLGPFNTTYDLDFWNRLAFWTIAITAVGTVIERCMRATVESPWLEKLHVAFRMLFGAMMGAIPGTSIIVAINMLFRPEHLIDAHFPVLWVQVTIMALFIAGLELLISNRFTAPVAAIQIPPQEQQSGQDPQKTISIPRLYHRLPDKLREGQIISMSMQDHYVEVTTTLGSEMLLMRLSDAIDLLDGMAGVQTHRSHWAARGHTISLAKAARRFDLTLSDGRKLPVSSRYKEAVEQMLNEQGQT